MTSAALIEVQRVGVFSLQSFGKGAGRGNIIRVDINNIGLRIDGRPSPLRPAIEPGEHNRVLANRKWHELAGTAKSSKLLQRPLMNLRIAVGKQIFGQDLACERSWLPRKPLGPGSDFAWHIAGWGFLVVDRIKRITGDAVEDEDETLFEGLRNRIDQLPVPPQCK